MIMNENTKSKKYWDEKSSHRIPNEKVIKAFAQAKISILKRNIPHLKQLSTLEVGCGDGYISRYLKNETNLTGADISMGMLKKNPLENKFIGSAYQLPFKDNSFDLVFESNMLHHLDYPIQAVEEMKRVSRAYMFLSEPNANSPAIYFSHRFNPDERQCCKYNLNFLEKLFNDTRIEIIEKKNGGRVPPNKTFPFMLPYLHFFENVLPGGFFSMILGKVSS